MNPKLKRVFSSLALSLVAVLAAAASTQAQGGIEILEQDVDYRFNAWMRVYARFASDEALVDGQLFLRAEGENQAQTLEAIPNGSNELTVEIDLTEGFVLRPFARVDYWFVVTSEGGSIYESPGYSFSYADNQFTWQSLSRGNFTVSWHFGGQDFGEAILSAAERGAARTQALLPLPSPERVEFWVYDASEDLQAALRLAGYDWVTGHTDPGLGVVLLSIAPGGQNSLEIERQVPHEVAHAMLYQAASENGYAQLPIWLIEGIASNAEAYSDPQRGDMLQASYSSGALIPLPALCAALPQDAETARLAYAEAASFVAYLRASFGVAGVGALVEAYASRGDCVNASIEVLGKDLAGLEADWLAATFNPKSGWESRLEQLPWASVALSALAAAALACLLRRRSRNR